MLLLQSVLTCFVLTFQVLLWLSGDLNAALLLFLSYNVTCGIVAA